MGVLPWKLQRSLTTVEAWTVVSQFVRRHERISNSVLIALINCDRDAFMCCAGDAVDVTASEFFLMKGISGFLNFWCGVPSNEGGVFNNCLRSIYFKIRKMLNV